MSPGRRKRRRKSLEISTRTAAAQLPRLKMTENFLTDDAYLANSTITFSLDIAMFRYVKIQKLYSLQQNNGHQNLIQTWIFFKMKSLFTLF